MTQSVYYLECDTSYDPDSEGLSVYAYPPKFGMIDVDIIYLTSEEEGTFDNVFFLYTGDEENIITIRKNTNIVYRYNEIDNEINENIRPYAHKVFMPIRLCDPNIIQETIFSVGKYTIYTSNPVFVSEMYEHDEETDLYYVKGNYREISDEDGKLVVTITKDVIGGGRRIAGYMKLLQKVDVTSNMIWKVHNLMGSVEFVHGTVKIEGNLYIREGETLDCESLIIV